MYQTKAMEIQDVSVTTTQNIQAQQIRYVFGQQQKPVKTAISTQKFNLTHLQYINEAWSDFGQTVQR